MAISHGIPGPPDTLDAGMDSCRGSLALLILISNVCALKPRDHNVFLLFKDAKLFTSSFL